MLSSSFQGKLEKGNLCKPKEFSKKTTVNSCSTGIYNYGDECLLFSEAMKPFDGLMASACYLSTNQVLIAYNR